MTHIKARELSEECKADIIASREYLSSESRKQYSSQRIGNDLGHLKNAAKAGLQILDEHGSEFLRSLSDSRPKRKQ